jgi:prephenate dehydrogenase
VAQPRIAILGVGLLGGSVGLALKAAGTNYHVVGYGHRASTLETAIQMGAIDEAFDSPERAVVHADLVLLATPVGLFESLLKQIAPHLRERALVTDVGSTKRSIVRAAETLLPRGAFFVGSHPMAGSEKRGVEFAKPDLFRGARCILTPVDRTDSVALNKVESFWKLLGCKTIRMSPEEHDRLICDISHLPHAVAAALVAMQEEAALTLAGQGFLDTTRVAGGDGGLWRDIFQDNRDNVVESLKRLRANLDDLVNMLEPARADELARWLNRVAQRRAQLLEAKLKELHAE